ncbi:ABC transporter six-transmembrane domain-containing protein [Stenotrophomonas maltophilia]|uniref:ABC transporter six-transmembrane domain-containing protein n=1 Tax=Stenotrophomonas maltophilia TaxID=40324 RepID=UPI00215582A0|nr:ABC transporter six-transmembrane domain-containing protein [Stenotrophomonas maltophilia]
MKHPHDPAAAAGSIGQQHAAATLKAILRTYPWQLTGTFSLVALENTLLLAYPLFAGFAVDAIIRGNIGHAISYAGVVLLFWLVGAARRAVDTRTFTRIYADLAVNVVQAQRRLGQATSTSAARVVLAREFVDFFEKHVPIIATALVSMFGAAVMLLAIEPLVGGAALLSPAAWTMHHRWWISSRG